jgi:hypothetical protein
MPDLTFLNNLSPLFQLAGGLGFGLMAAYLYFKARQDQKKVATAIDPAEQLRMRWDGPVGKHLELMEEVAKGFGFRAELIGLIQALEERVRECERAIDRMPGSDRH